MTENSPHIFDEQPVDEQLAARVDELERTVRAQAARISSLEQQVIASSFTFQSSISNALPPTAKQVSSSSKSSTAADTVNQNTAQKSASRPALEDRIGGQWLNRIGVIVLIFGTGFFLKYAFDNAWIAERGRVLIGFALGVAALLGGVFVRARGYRDYASGLFGGGIVVLYLSAYAAHAFYNLINQVPAFALMAGVTALAVLLAARYDALPIAAIGLIGGFLTPPLLASSESSEVTLFSYALLLDAGVLALAYRKAWRSLNYMAFIATTITFIGWAVTYYTSEKFGRTMLFATLFFVIFIVVTVLHNIIQKRASQWLDASLILANASAFFAIGYLLLQDSRAGFQSSFALLLSGIYWLLYVSARGRVTNDRLLISTLFGVAVMLLTTALAIQLEQQTLTISWAIEAAILMWIGLRVSNKIARVASLAVFTLAAWHWFFIVAPEVSSNAQDATRDYVLLFNRRAASGLVLTAALGFAAWFYAGTKSNADEVRSEFQSEVRSERRNRFGFLRRAVLNVPLMLFIAANLLLLTLLSVEAWDYLAHQSLQQTTQVQAVNQAAIYDSSSRQQLALSVLWTIYAGVLLIAGVARRVVVMRVMALLLLAVTIAKVFLFDLQFLTSVNRIISFLVLGAVLLGVSFLYQRKQRQAFESQEPR